ncbi:MAG: LPS export ABC transporter periplasmic protein LptC [Bacteroidota bacterium]
MFRKRWILFLSIPAAVAVGIFFSQENDLEEVKQLVEDEILPVQSVRDAKFVYTDSARVKFRLFADKLDKYTGIDPFDEYPPYMEFPEGVRVISYNRHQQQESELTADYAINYERTRIMEAKNNVVVVNRKGEQLNTEHLIWDEGLGKIHTEEFVKITTEDEIIYGRGLEANEDFTQYTIKNITGEIQIREEAKQGEEVQ